MLLWNERSFLRMPNFDIFIIVSIYRSMYLFIINFSFLSILFFFYFILCFLFTLLLPFFIFHSSYDFLSTFFLFSFILFLKYMRNKKFVYCKLSSLIFFFEWTKPTRVRKKNGKTLYGCAQIWFFREIWNKVR